MGFVQCCSCYSVDNLQHGYKKSVQDAVLGVQRRTVDFETNKVTAVKIVGSSL